MEKSTSKPKLNSRKTFLVVLVIIIAGVAYALFRNIAIHADVIGNVGILKVVVNDSVGVPLDAATVKVTSDQTNQTITLTKKDNNGFYTATVGQGSFVINADATGYTSDSQPTEVEGGQSQEISFYLTKQ